MNKVIIIRWCEIHLKGKNRNHFEKLLEDNIKHSIKEIPCKFTKIQGRYLLENFDENFEDVLINKLKKISGIHTISVATSILTNFEDIARVSVEICKYKRGTFKVETRRADKKFELHSIECSREIGARILSSNPNLTVDVHNPNFTLNVDIRESGRTLIFTDFIKGMGGMPTGSAGKGLLMISGGIDSPVAGYMIAKRGMRIEAVHFHSYPYTSELAKEKVITLAKMVGEYSNGITLHIVKFTEIQEAIHEKCPSEYMITLMRRFMMRISEIIAKNNGAQTIITGESLGQVASQTIESITSSNSVVKMPVLRPLIAFDKLDIIEISEKIGTFETSILPYEDCCTVFLPEHPIIKPKLENVEKLEQALDINELINKALETVETIKL